MNGNEGKAAEPNESAEIVATPEQVNTAVAAAKDLLGDLFRNLGEVQTSAAPERNKPLFFPDGIELIDVKLKVGGAPIVDLRVKVAGPKGMGGQLSLDKDASHRPVEID